MCREESRRGLEAETDAEVIESENWKLNIEENVVGLPLWKGKEAWFFLVPKGRFSDGQEGDSWWDENNRCSRPTKTHPSVRVKKNIKNMKQSQMNFKEIRLALLLFLQLLPKHASRFQATNHSSPIQKTIGKTGKRLGL